MQPDCDAAVVEPVPESGLGATPTSWAAVGRVNRKVAPRPEAAVGASLMRRQFRAEAFNLTNTPDFAAPNTNLGSPTFGEITAAAPNSNPRRLQFALRLSF